MLQSSRSAGESGVGTLVLGILTVESSYAESLERPADQVPDTVQFWFTPDATWRVRTYAMDHDVHPHRVDGVDVDFAQEHIRRNYGDVLGDLRVLTFADVRDLAVVRAELRRAGLRDSAELSPEGIPLWLPDDAEYRTQSRPR